MPMGALGNRRMLATALALSLLAHLFLATFVHVKPVTAAPSPIIRVITHIYVHPTPTPQPLVRPQPRRHVVAVNVVPRSLPRTHEPRLRNGAGPIAPISPTGEPTAPGNTGPNGGPGASGPPGDGVPSMPAAPACSDPNAEATTIVAVSPDAPAGDTAIAANTTAMIKVDLDANGAVTGVSVYASAGSPELDQAAMQAARSSTYAPERRDCRPVAGSYLFKVEFSN